MLFSEEKGPCIYSFWEWLRARLPCAAVTRADFKCKGTPGLADDYVAEVI